MKIGLLFFSFLVFLSNALAEAPRYRVGIILPLTGDVANFGLAMKNGFLMGFEKLPPEVQSRISYIIEDDGMQAKNSVAAYTKLKTTDDINFLLSVSSGVGNALAPILERDRITMISIASDSKISKGKEHVFNFLVTPETEAKAVYQEVLRRGYKRIARINTVHDGAFSESDAFDTENNNHEIEIVLDEAYPIEIKDFKTYITKLKKIGKIDALLVNLFPGQLGVFAKQLRQFGFQQTMFGFELFEDPNDVKVSEGGLIGSWYATYAENDDFTETYMKRYPGLSSFGASNAHDVALLLGEAIKKNIPPEQFNTMLKTLKDFTGALGTYSATGDNRFTMPSEIKVVTKDGFKRLEERKE